MSTQSTQHMLQHYDDMVTKWTSIPKVMSSVLQHEFTNLRKHIATGCLSGVEPGLGTNRNERLHRYLNSSALAVGRIGPQLAIALLTVLLYKWNMARLKVPIGYRAIATLMGVTFIASLSYRRTTYIAQNWPLIP